MIRNAIALVPVLVVVAAAGAAVCNQTGVTATEESVAKPENESLNSTLGTEVMQCQRRASFSGLIREDLYPGLFRVYLSVSGGTLAQVSYSLDGSQFMDFVLCETQDDVLCIEMNFAAEGVQSVKVPAGVTLKNGTDEFDVESITRLPCFTPNHEPVNNSTDPPPSVSDCTGTVAATGTVLAIPCIVVVLLLIGCIYYCQKSRRLQRDIETLRRDTTARGSIPAAGPSLQQIGVDPPEPTDDPPEPMDDPPLADVLPARKTPSPVLKRGLLERHSSLTSSELASPALHVTPNREMPTSKPEDPEAPQASRVGEDPNQKDTTAIVWSSQPP